MELSKALEIIQALADGHNPYTGEVFEKDNVFQNPDTVRALYVGIEALNRMISYERRKRLLPENVGKAWTPDEEEEVVKEFDSGLSVKDIAVKHGRTKGGIEVKLAKYDKLPYAVVTKYRDRRPE